MPHYIGNDTPMNFSNVVDPDALDRVPQIVPGLIPVKTPTGPKDFSVPFLPKWSHGPILFGGVIMLMRIFTGPIFKKGK